jgi:hypothetical protein
MAKRNVSGVIDQLRKAIDSTFEDDKEYFGYTVKYTFEKAVNNALLGNGTEQKAAPKPRRKRGPNKPKPPLNPPEVKP